MKTNLALLDQTNGQSPRRLADTKAKIGSDKTNESFKTPPRRQIVRQVSSDSNAEKYAFVTTRRCRTRRRSFLKTPPPTVVSKDVKGLEDGLTDVSDTPQRKPRATSTSSDTENARRSTLPDLSSPKVNKTTDNKTPNAEVGDFYYFEALIGHDGPPSNRSKTSKGSVYNVLVKWANGEESWEPLNQMIEDAPEECAKYAADNDLLDELGWASLKKYLDEGS